MDKLVVVGAGQAAYSLIEAYRKGGGDAEITLIGAEATPPYQRPPLSKAYLLGETTVERLYFRPQSWFDEARVTLLLGRRAARIDRDARVVELEDGESISYDRLAITTGSSARRLPAAIGGDLPGVYTLRDLTDADALAPEACEGRRALVVGGGYIGLEAAAVLRKRGAEVTLLEAGPRILARVASQATSDYFRELHVKHGVDLREGVKLERFEAGADGRVARAILEGDAALEMDFALVGVGAAPEAKLAEAAGLEIDNGVAVDAAARTSDPNIVAAGDCASFPYRGRRIRLESVQNAIDQAQAAAATLLGHAPAYDPTPWFWSDQYDVKLQIAGLGGDATDWVRRPGAREGAQSIWYYADETLVAVDAMNDPRSYMMGKRWLEGGLSPEKAAIADADQDLKSIAAA